MESVKVLEQLSQGFDCSQVFLSDASKKYGLMDDCMAKRVSACFGCGMWSGQVCGAVTGAYMALGLKYGHSSPNEKDAKDITTGKISQFNKMFEDRYNSILCEDILGYNLARPDELERIMYKGLLTVLCPQVVSEALEMLDTCMEEG
ncbi:C-GCAxxG-C-C family protein [Parabacteroides sp. OttesenSCG-928-G07]|nr:C-GCAxxG-C-C family protein [Parabacteroides sp. OttesenSCG-928-G21]MDL2278183.1 C-GCAxxG-C-C family protein [Parabacteroides sp. OttesenSCG-928-G07]